MDYITVKNIFIEVLKKTIGSKRTINDKSTEEGKIFTLRTTDVDGMADNLATWWTEETDIDIDAEMAENYLDECYPTGGN